jgi:hypothetical protein
MHRSHPQAKTGDGRRATGIEKDARDRRTATDREDDVSNTIIRTDDPWEPASSHAATNRLAADQHTDAK